MTLDEKIAVLQAAKRGEKIQSRQIDYFGVDRFNRPKEWTTIEEPFNECDFNFAVFEYRIAHKNSITVLTRNNNTYDVTANDDGSITFGCDTVRARDVDAIFALRDKGKLCF